MLIIAKILEYYCVNQNISRANRLSNLKYVNLEVTIKYIVNIKLKRLMKGKKLSPHFEIQNGGLLVRISSGSLSQEVVHDM